MATEKEVLRFLHPCTMMIVGPTMSGKTQIFIRCLREKMFKVVESKLNKKNLERPYPDRLIWVHGQSQPAHDEVKALVPDVEFRSDFNFDLDAEQTNLIVIDDMMSEAKDDKRVSAFFTKGAHHRNTSVMLIVQNLFAQGKEMRTI